MEDPRDLPHALPRRGLHQSCLGQLSHWQQNFFPHLTSSWENPANKDRELKSGNPQSILALLWESVGRNLGNEFIPQRVISTWFSNKNINLGLHPQESFGGPLHLLLPLATSGQIINHAIALCSRDHLVYSSLLQSGRAQRWGAWEIKVQSGTLSHAAEQPPFPAAASVPRCVPLALAELTTPPPLSGQGSLGCFKQSLHMAWLLVDA